MEISETERVAIAVLVLNAEQNNTFPPEYAFAITVTRKFLKRVGEEAKEVTTKKLKWATVAPTAEGFYWMENDGDLPRVVRLIWAHHPEMMVACGYRLSKYPNAKFAGPLEKP